MPSGTFGVVDLFAGPGGLSEGLSEVRASNGRSPFGVCLSVEMEPAAHQTLLLRKFLRNFDVFPREYYEFLHRGGGEPDWSSLYPREWRKAESEALRLTLGDPVSARIIDKRIKDTIRQFGGRTILIGGPPCQAYSIAGRSRNAGIAGYEPSEDARHFLYEEYVRVLGMLRPAAFVMENVKGILSSSPQGFRIFNTVLRDLQTAGGASGYTLFAIGKESQDVQGGITSVPHEFIVRSEHYGVPQARHRVIIIGLRQDVAEAAERRHGPSGVRELLHLARSAKIASVSSVLRGMPKLRSGLSDRLDNREAWRECFENAIRRVLSSIDSDASEEAGRQVLILKKRQSAAAQSAAKPRSSGRPCGVPRSCAQELRTWLEDPMLQGLPQHEARAHMEGDLARYIFASSFAEVHGRSPIAREYPLALAPRHRNWASGKFADRFRVQTWKKPATTVTSHISKDGHYYIHPDPAQCRSLTVREAARLQTFPDNYYFKGNRTQQYTQVGNAVPPFLAYQIGKALWAVLNVGPAKKAVRSKPSRKSRSTA